MKYIYYFDSLALPAPLKTYFLDDIINQNVENLCINKAQIQSYSSNICGLYCILFVYAMFVDENFNEFLMFFDYKDTTIKDKLYTDLFFSLMKLCDIK